MSDSTHSTIVLRALKGRPLTDKKVRAIVESSAWAIGERTGVRVISVETEDDRIRVALECSRLVAVGFAAELRRLTERWYAAKFPDSNRALWGLGPDREKPDDDSDAPGSGGWRPDREDDDDWWRGGERDLGSPG